MTFARRILPAMGAKVPQLPGMLLILWLVASTSLFAGTKLQESTEAFLKNRMQKPKGEAVKDTALGAILARPDPGTFFLRYAFGLQRHSKKLLTPEQSASLAKVLESDAPTHSRWHDERNMLRCKFNEVMWLYAGADNAEAAKLLAELQDWMRLRMLWTQQEHLAQYRFGRDVWNVLDADRQNKLINGEWKDYAAQDTGHTRGDATAKIITKALGKPDKPAEFERLAKDWSVLREPLHHAVSEAENRERCIVFAMDLNSEAPANAACVTATDAYAKLYLTEAEAIRRIVQAGYSSPKPRCQQAASEAWNEATKRFSQGAPDLFSVLTAP